METLRLLFSLICQLCQRSTSDERDHPWCGIARVAKPRTGCPTSGAADARHLGGRLAMTRLETVRSNRNCTKKAGAAADKAAQMTDTCEKIQV